MKNKEQDNMSNLRIMKLQQKKNNASYNANIDMANINVVVQRQHKMSLSRKDNGKMLLNTACLTQ